MKRGSLRRRLLGLLVLLPLALGVTGVIIDVAFWRAQETSIRQSLLYSSGTLLELPDLDGEALAVAREPAEPAFSQINGPLMARLLSADGAVLWQSRSALGRELPQTPLPEGAAPPDVQYLSALSSTVAATVATDPESYHLLRRWVQFELGPLHATDKRLQTVIIEVWQSSSVTAPVATAFGRTLWSGLLALTLLLALALWGVLQSSLRPLARVREELVAMQAGRQQHFESEYPEEIHGLTTAIDQLLLGERRQRERHRQRLSDLAHSLKTPLAVLQAECSTADEDSLIRAQLMTMDETIAWHLKRGAGAGSGWQAPIPLRPVLQRLVVALEKVYQRPSGSIGIDVPQSITVAVDQGDLLEIFGNLLDNACKHGGQRVQVAAEREEKTEHVRIWVDDDGTGVPPAERERVLQRGVRADTRAPGQGIGLAVVAELVLDYGGSIRVEDSPLGGARVTLGLPTGTL